MVAPTPANLLRAWEQGACALPFERAILLLAAAGETEERLVALSLGQRDAALLRLRVQLFGERLSGVADCPRCKTRVEVTLAATDLQTGQADDDALVFRSDGCVVRLRRLTTLDLRAIAGEATPRALLERAIVAIEGGALARDERWLEKIGGQLERADPHAHLELALRCPECRDSWTVGYDVAGFLWNEVEAWSLRLLREVHLLASHYGWSEHDILELPPTRRRRYLELIRE
jgi:hypothetical protein